MKVFFPSYYKEFKCIADSCRHSCCVGWEIGVDDCSAERFSSVGGALGEKIRRNITSDNTIRLTEGDRCPFLDGCGLCQIISELGEDMTPRICREHPRFYHRVGETFEGGIGMSCEVAARIILSSDGFASFTEYERDAEAADESDFDTLTHREYIYNVLSSGDSYREKLSDIAKKYDLDISFSTEYWSEVFSGLEYLNAKNAESFSVGRTEHRIENHRYLTRFLAYLVFRHVSMADSYDNLRARVGFCLLLTAVLENMIAERDISFAEICERARTISEEIEYSEDNTASLIFEFEAWI